MAWIELHQSLVNHRKTMVAADLLGMPPVHLVGHLVTFWLWALDNSEEGGLSNIPNRTIARVAQWPDDPDRFVDTLVEAGFFDRSEDGLSIHDWHQYAGRLIDRKKANAERMKTARATHVSNTSDARAGATVPNRTQPNLTIPDSTRPGSPGADADASEQAGDSNPTNPEWLKVLSELEQPTPHQVKLITKWSEGHDGQTLKDTACQLVMKWPDVLKDNRKKKPPGVWATFQRWVGVAERSPPSGRTQDKVKGRHDQESNRAKYIDEYKRRRGHLPWEEPGSETNDNN